MKKTYINPEMDIVMLQTMQMLAASDPENGFNKSTTTELESTEDSGNLGRGGFLDDDF